MTNYFGTLFSVSIRFHPDVVEHGDSTQRIVSSEIQRIEVHWYLCQSDMVEGNHGNRVFTGKRGMP